MHLKFGCLLTLMNEQPPHAPDLSTLVHRLFAHRFQASYDLFLHIQQDIERREALHDDILAVIDEQIRVHRNRLLEFQGWLKHDSSLWLHPRRSHLEQALSDWQQQRIAQLTQTFAQIQPLQTQSREAIKTLTDAQRSQGMLDAFTGYGYAALR